jgi:PilZ domain
VFHSNPESWTADQAQRRQNVRHDVQCRARIRIANRQYAGYLHNISRAGAKLRTITPIRRVGTIILRLPDLPPLLCELKWSDHYNAGVAFGTALSADELSGWLSSRFALGSHAEIEAQGG